jgi:hypothetical protein
METLVKYYFQIGASYPQAPLAIDHIITFAHTIFSSLLAESFVCNITAFLGSFVIAVVSDAFASFRICVSKLAAIDGCACGDGRSQHCK